MRGRKPKPKLTKKLEGNPGKRPFNQLEPVIADGVPAPPPYLNKDGVAEWHRKLAELPKGLITKVDDGTLGNYCLAYQNLCEAQRDLKKNGRTQTNRMSKLESPRPAVADEKNAMLMMQRFGAEMGFSPSSRSRIEVPKQPDEDSLEAFNQPLRLAQ